MAINILNIPTTLPTTTVLPPIPVNVINTASYNFQTTDGNAWTRFNVPGATTATILANTFAIGVTLTAEQAGAGLLSVVAGPGVTINPSSPVVSLGTSTVIVLFQAALNVWTAKFALSSPASATLINNSSHISAGSANHLLYDTGGILGELAVNSPLSIAGSALNVAAAATYYISAVGSDANNGTSPATPWQTITKVNAQTPAPGTSFLFRAGDTFTGTVVVAASGIPGQPITYDTYGDNQSGGTILATISSSSANGFTIGEFDNLVIQNFNIVGSGIGAGGALNLAGPHGISVLTTLDHNNYTINNCTISNYPQDAILFYCGDVTAVTNPIVRNVTVTNCTIHDCGQNGVQIFTHNNRTTTHPLFVAFANVFVSNCTVFNCPYGSSAVSVQGSDGLTIQNCVSHDMARLSTAGASGPAFYCADANNFLIQFNEAYNQYARNADGGGILTDFDSQNGVVQYNYIHNCGAYGISCDTHSFVSNTVHTTNNNLVYRYNIIVNCGYQNINNTKLSPPGIQFICLNNGEVIQNVYVYNNTIIADGNTTNNGVGIFNDDGNVGTMSGIVANNLFIGGANTFFATYTGRWRFVNNDYVGGAPSPINFGGTTYSLSAWLALSATVDENQERLDGVDVHQVVDPLMLCGPGGAPTSSAGQPSAFQVSPMTPVSKLGLDLTKTLPIQTQVPFRAPWAGVGGGSVQQDADFRGSTFFGCVVGDFTCSRTSAQATNLLFNSPENASFTTFAANTLRITSGKGLLIEGARTQYLASPTAPATQTTGSIPNGTNLILWVNGPGSATLTSGTGTVSAVQPVAVATQGNPCIYTMGSTGNVVCTVTGTLFAFQLENSPDSDFLPTSLIAAAGTRDADVITTPATGGIGQGIQTVLNSAFGGAIQAVVTLPAHIVSGGPSFVRCIATDDTNISYIGTSSAGGNAINSEETATVSIGGTVLNSTSIIAANQTQVMNYRTDPTVALALSLNGDFISTTSIGSSSPNNNPIHIGNRTAADQALQGYLQRLMVWGSSPSNVATTIMSTLTSLTPIGVNVTRDFFNNIVPFNGQVGIGAHQPTTSGNVVTLNGSTAVTVADTIVTANSNIFFTLKSVGGTVGTYPTIKTITPGTGFTVNGTTGDTSTYNFVVF